MEDQDQELQEHFDFLDLEFDSVEEVKVRQAVLDGARMGRMVQKRYGPEALYGFVTCNNGYSCKCGGLIPVGKKIFHKWCKPTVVCGAARSPNAQAVAIHKLASKFLKGKNLRKLER